MPKRGQTRSISKRGHTQVHARQDVPAVSRARHRHRLQQDQLHEAEQDNGGLGAAATRRRAEGRSGTPRSSRSWPTKHERRRADDASTPGSGDGSGRNFADHRSRHRLAAAAPMAVRLDHLRLHRRAADAKLILTACCISATIWKAGGARIEFRSWPLLRSRFVAIVHAITRGNWR